MEMNEIKRKENIKRELDREQNPKEDLLKTHLPRFKVDYQQSWEENPVSSI